MKQFLIIFATCLSLFGCAKADFDYIGASSSKAEKYFDPRFEEFLESKPESKRDYYVAMNEAASILAFYLKLDGTNYILDITEAQAKELGISRKIYLKQIESLREANEHINKSLAEGKKVLFTDPQKTMARYKDPRTHITLEKAYQKKKGDDPTDTQVRTKTGKIYTADNNQTSSSPKVDFVASTFSGTCGSNVLQNVLVNHDLSIYFNGKLVGKLVVPQKAGCEKEKFNLLLEDHKQAEGESIKYKIYYQAITEDGGICEWVLTERKNLGDIL